MQPLLIVKGQIPTQFAAGLFGSGVVFEVDFLILDRPPQTLRENIVQRSPPTVHADDHIACQQSVDVLRAREMAALMGNSISFKEDYNEAFEDNYDGVVEEDYEEKSEEIRQLEAIRDAIRGNPYDESGSLKLLGR